MKIAVRGIDRGSGYGNVAQDLIAAFRDAGVTVVPPDTPAPALLHILPPHFFAGKFQGQRAWLLSMWETENCPEGFRAGFPNFDGVICPTHNNLAAFSEYHPNVHRVNMGVDWKFWTPQPRVLSGTFRFLYTAHSPSRKGGHLALEAGRRLARTHDVEMVAASAATDVELRDLFWSCHAYVQPSRGEGWGMMPHQALASGMPAVVSDCPGHREYAHLPGCVTSRTEPAASALTFHGEPGNWWEPDVDDLVEKMRMVVDGYDDYREAALKAHDVCRVEFDWSSIAAHVLDLVDVSGSDPDRAWVPAVFDTFPVLVNRNVECDIGDTRYRFEKGVEARVSPDVKRVLREAGYLVAG